MESISDFQIVSWTTEDGLPQNSVNDIIQTDDGYIWLATYGGLVRFDGLTFKTFHIGNTRGLESNRLKTLLESNSGGLWLGHDNGGVTVFKNGIFETPPALDSLNHEFVEDFSDDSEGNVWIGTGKGLYKFDGRGVKKYDNANGLPTNDVVKLFYNPKGGIYVTTGGRGLNNPSLSAISNDSVHMLSSYPRSPYFNILDLNSRGELWLAYKNRLELYINGIRERTIRYTYIKENKTQCFYIDKDRNFWLGSNKGLIMIPAAELQNDEKDSHVSIRTFDAPELEKNIRRIIQDQEGNIWVGSDGSGLTMLRKRHVKRYYPPLGVGNQSFDEIASDGEGGLWFGSLCNGLYHYRNGIFGKFTPSFDCIDALSNDPENEKIVYVGSKTRLGMIRDYQYHEITDLADIDPGSDPYYWQISSINKDSNGTLWIGTKGSGLIVLKDSTLEDYSVRIQLPGDWVHTIVSTSKNEVWVGTDGGITIIKDDSFRYLTAEYGLVRGAIRCIYEDEKGVIWAGSYGGGLSRITGDEIINYTTDDGLAENVISRLKEDINGNLWMLGNLGLTMVTKHQFYDLDKGIIRELTCLPFGSEEGMEEGNGAGGVAETADGLTWWATIKGIAGINIDQNYNDPNPPQVALQEIKVSNQPVDLYGNEVFLSESQRDLEVTYTGLKYSSPHKIRYRYKLEGYDEGWRSNSNRRIITYTNLDPGNYQLKIQASGLNGAWGKTFTSLKIIVKPKFYQLIWFRVVVIIILLILVWLVFSVRERYLVRKRLELSEIIRSRTDELNVQNKKLESQKRELEMALESLKETQKRLIQSEKMASLGVMAAGVAHEINNPLQFIQNGLDIIKLAQEDLQGLQKKLPVSLEIIENGIERASAIVSSLTQFSRINDRFDEQFDVRTVLDNCLIMMSSSLKSDIEVKKEYSDDALITVGNQGKLHQAFLNILLNADQAIDKSGTIEVSASRTDVGIRITIADSGEGISLDKTARIFDPFYTTKEPGKGTGLGLSITYDIITQHQGTISVKSDGAGKGTTFTIILPAV